jgi:hypothetical protein
MKTKHIGLKEKNNGRISKNWEMNLKEFFVKYFQYKEINYIKKPWYVPTKVWNNIIIQSKNRGYNDALLEFRVTLVDIIENDNVHTTKKRK